jgi:uncharacterized protein (TIGR02118 family)
MSDTHFALFRRPADETPESFARRVRATASELAAGPKASTIVSYVDDGNVGAPPEVESGPPSYDGALLIGGVPRKDLPNADALYGVRRRVIKARTRGRNGARSAGFTRVFLVNRANHIDHEQFNAHWRDSHSRVHVESSPGTRHYEQLIIDEALTPGAGQWDGFSLISFGSSEDFTELRYGPGGAEAIAADSIKFVASPTETFATSEFVYLDDATESMYRDEGS